MAVLQSSYATSIPVGYAGMIAEGQGIENIISRVLESSAGIGFGQPAFQGSNDRGCVIGATFGATGTPTAGSSNTGTGTMGAVTVSAGAKQGTYQLVVIEPASNAGAFAVYDPDGVFVDNGNVASAFSAGGLAFTLADGGTDFVSGDSFSIAVAYTADADFLGLTKKDTTVPPNTANPDVMPQYWNVPIMTGGVMWVTAGATVVAGGAVYWNPSTSRFTSTATHIQIPRARFDSGGVNGDLVRVAIRH